MSHVVETIPDLTEQLTFDAVSEPAITRLLDHGLVVIQDVVPSDEIEGVKQAVDTLFFESLPSRVLYKILENAPIARLRDTAHHRHSTLSQFYPTSVPTRLSSATPAIERVTALDTAFFLDVRLQERYAGHAHRLNIADVSRSTPEQKAFVAHQDSHNVSKLGHVLQPVDSRWVIHGGHEPSRKPFDYAFIVSAGSVVTTLERSGPKPVNLPPGQGLEYYLEDGSEVHSGDNLTEEIRHRLALFAQESDLDHRAVGSRWRDPLVAAIVKFNRDKRHH